MIRRSALLVAVLVLVVSSSIVTAGTSPRCMTPIDGVFDWRCPLDPAATSFPLFEPTGPQQPDFGFDPDGLSLVDAAGAGGGGGGSAAKPVYVPPNWAAGNPNWATWTTTGVFGVGWAALAADGDIETIEDVGDNTQFIPVLWGLGMALGAKDWKGSRQFVWSGLLSTGTIHLLKNTSDKYRPDASNTQSFPSGHTQASWFGAGFIMQRYGPKWGIPAMTMAAYTGYSRITAQKHFTDDVISGMSIALFSNFLLVEPADAERRERWADKDRPRNRRFELEVSDAEVGANTVQAPAGVGTVIDYQFDEVADPLVSASVAFDMVLKKRHNVKIRWSPFEIRDIGTLEEDTLFGETVFPAGSDIFSVYFFGDLRARYAWGFFPESSFDLQLGGGATLIDTSVELYPRMGGSIDEDAGERVRANGLLPLLYGYIGYDFTKLIGIYLEVDWVEVSSDSFLDAAFKLTFQITPKWDVAIGYRSVNDDLEVEDIKNKFERDGGLIHVAYSF